MRDHTKLKAFVLADQLAILVYRNTASFPKEEIFGLTAQIRRAAVSVASNIVEGSARLSEAEYVHFLDIAYGSFREVEYQAGLSYRLGFLSTAGHAELLPIATETAKVLNGLLRALRKTDPAPALSLPPPASRLPPPASSLQPPAFSLRPIA